MNNAVPVTHWQRPLALGIMILGLRHVATSRAGPSRRDSANIKFLTAVAVVLVGFRLRENVTVTAGARRASSE